MSQFQVAINFCIKLRPRTAGSVKLNSAVLFHMSYNWYWVNDEPNGGVFFSFKVLEVNPNDCEIMYRDSKTYAVSSYVILKKVNNIR
jgi:hypothetical protein